MSEVTAGDIVRLDIEQYVVVDAGKGDPALCVLRRSHDTELEDPLAVPASDLEVIDHLNADNAEAYGVGGWSETAPGVWEAAS